jgi:membrane-bound serine protease (ClpP class)
MFSVLHAWLTHLSPNAAVLILTLGLLLIYYELNRPGSILPGAFGLLITLLSIAALAPYRINPNAIVLILLAIALLTHGLLRPTSIAVSAAATIALIFGLRTLIVPACCGHISTSIAIGCGLLLGVGTSVLTRVARRARVNKGLD